MIRSQRQHQPYTIPVRKMLLCRAKKWPCPMSIVIGKLRTVLSKQGKLWSLSLSLSQLSGTRSPCARNPHTPTIRAHSSPQWLAAFLSMVAVQTFFLWCMTSCLPRQMRPQELSHFRTKTLLPTSYLKIIMKKRFNIRFVKFETLEHIGLLNSCKHQYN